VSDLLLATGTAASVTARMLVGLRVHPDRMAENVARTEGLVNAEAVVGALAPSIGHRRARALVEAAAHQAIARGTPFRDELLKAPEAAQALDSASIDSLLDPAAYLGAADALVDRALADFAEEQL
jgi:3-carboxy-cis,cis-muconate cycloisomerase